MFKLRRNATFAAAEVICNSLALFSIYRLVLADLGPRELGAWSILTATTAFARMADIGTGSGLTRFAAISIGQGNKDDAREFIETGVISNIVFFIFIGAVLYFPIGLAIRFQVKQIELYTELKRLIPASIITFILMSSTNVVFSAIIGLHNSWIKSIISVLGSLIQLAFVFLFIKKFGLASLAIGQIIQYVAVLVLGWLALRKIHSQLSWFPKAWSYAKLRLVLAYGGKLQLVNFGSVLFESGSKLVIGNVAGLGTLGVYEVAYRFTQQMRLLAGSALQTLVPVMASLSSTDGNALRQMFKRSASMAFLIGVVVMGVSIIGSPVLGLIIIPSKASIFTSFTEILALGYVVNISFAPAYLLAMALGRLKWIVVGGAGLAILAPTFAFVGGMIGGGAGAAAGAMLALALQSILIHWRVMRDVGYRLFIGQRLGVVLLGLAVLVFTLAISHYINANTWFLERAFDYLRKIYTVQ